MTQPHSHIKTQTHTHPQKHSLINTQTHSHTHTNTLTPLAGTGASRGNDRLRGVSCLLSPLPIHGWHVLGASHDATRVCVARAVGTGPPRLCALCAWHCLLIWVWACIVDYQWKCQSIFRTCTWFAHKHTHTHSLSLSLSRAHTHTYTHTPSLSLSLSLSLFLSLISTVFLSDSHAQHQNGGVC